MEKMINLETFADGALAEKINMALKEVLENIADPNTDYKTKRKLTVDMTFASEEDRELTEVSIVAKPKLAPTKPLAAKIVIGTDGKGGILASEYKKQIPGQSTMRVDEETGEVLTTAEEKEVDLKGIKLVK
ncbi:replication terminator protein [Clostridium sporogenes]|uniref:replication terminator protein n=1 Tax=Clostridium sporogenes TaxID=1509 RepID=UPI0013D52BF9|nr:replication terminator protein [Clostridium sporogenes]NFD94631.1 replication terminator protein [Clostridium sporogenes]NFE45218.1 replication terminator protein [Clostridium sporogenes]NFF16671.1 replication terminator protein [Clostridium sporogenes]NFF74021.1 replication terminator protein [Clostridium sporogenes]NFF77384.1 replication terminator protein [Clostridium sporogenes]